MPALTLSVHKFLNIKQTPKKLETFPKMYLRTIFFNTELFTSLDLPFVKKCIVVTINLDFLFILIIFDSI